MSNAGKIHELYHEARRRANLPQPIVWHSKEKSILLSAPNNIIFELFNTIIKEISGDRLLEFIKSNLTEYLDINWTNKITQRVVKRLRREQAVDVKAGLKDMPIIRTPNVSHPLSISTLMQDSKSPPPPPVVRTSPTSSSINPALDYLEALTSNDKQTAIRQLCEHIMWRINSDNVTQITILLVKLIIDDGYRCGKLKAELYDDVLACFKDWRSSKLIKLYAFGNAPANDQKLMLSSTDKGDLTKWIANYIDGSEKRQKSDLIRKLAGALRDKTKNCIYITHDLTDALKSIQVGEIRCALVVDRNRSYETTFKELPEFSSIIEPLMVEGKLYIVGTLNCVEFAIDPTSETCC